QVDHELARRRLEVIRRRWKRRPDRQSARGHRRRSEVGRMAVEFDAEPLLIPDTERLRIPRFEEHAANAKRLCHQTNSSNSRYPRSPHLTRRGESSDHHATTRPFNVRSVARRTTTSAI